MRRAAGFVAQVAVLFGFWLLLSDQNDDVVFLGMGLVAALLVTVVTHVPVSDSLGTGGPDLLRLPVRALRFARYVLWLLWRMLVGSLQVSMFVCRPTMPIRPAFLHFHTELETPLARVVLANSITLVPGTMTVRLSGTEYLVHALVPSAAEDLVDATMQNKIAHIFDEGPQPAPDAPVWEWREVR